MEIAAEVWSVASLAPRTAAAAQVQRVRPLYHLVRQAPMRSCLSIVLLLLSARQGDQAIADYTKAIQLNSNYTQAYINRAAAYRKTGQTALAEADERRTGPRSELAASPPPPASSAQSVAGYRPNWIGQTMTLQGTVSRFVLRDVNGEPYVYLYFKERPDSTVVACARDAPWLLAVLGIDDFKSLVGKTLELNLEVVNQPCTSSGASLWIYQRTQARIAGDSNR